MIGPTYSKSLNASSLADGWLRFFTSENETLHESNPGELSALLIVAAVAVLAILPVMIYGIPSNVDLSNHFRFAVPFYESIRAGHLYPGWLAETNGGLGDPSFRFYPPGLYYLLAATRALTGNWYAASVLTFTLISVTGGLGMYFWARVVLPRNIAICAAVIYTLAPYHVNQLYQALMLAEYAASAVLPFAFAFAHRVCRSGRKRDMAGLAAAYALLILTNLPLAVIGSLALMAYALLCVDWKKDLGSTLLRLLLSALLGLAASACFWVTMIAELKWIGLNGFLADSSVDYRRNFIFSTFSPDNLNVWWLNILTFATVLMFLPALAYFHRGWKSERRDHNLRAVAILMVVAFLMMTYVSWPIWRLFRALQEVQFPWRWLSVVSMAGSLVAAAFIPFWIDKARGKGRPIAIAICGAVAISVSFTLFQLVRQAQFLSRSEFETKLQSLSSSQGLEYWWPVWAAKRVHSGASQPEITTRVDAGSRAVLIGSWQSEDRSFQVADGPAIDARVHTFYYPHWTATASGTSLQVRPSDDGTILISLPPEATTVQLKFHEPLRSKVSAATSVAGWGLIFVLALFPSRRSSLSRASR